MKYQAARLVFLVCTAAGAVVDFARPGGAQVAPAPLAACARPNVAGSVLRAVAPDTPPIAAQQGISGEVQVVVSLDTDSHVVATRIQSSPSAVLNQAALSAARQSSFQTEIRDCHPVARDYIFTVYFAPKATFSTTAAGERVVSVVGLGSVRRTPDSAVVQTSLVTRDDVAVEASAKNDAAFEVLKAKLGELGISNRTTASPAIARQSRSAAATNGSGYTAIRQVAIVVDSVANAGRVAAAVASQLVVDGVAIRYTLNDHAAASRDALAAALNDAENAAREAVTSQRLHLGERKTVIVRPDDRAPAPSTVVPFFLTQATAGFMEADIRIPDVAVNVTAVVTYAVRP